MDGRCIPIRVFTSRQRYGDPKAVLPAREAYFGAQVRLWTSQFGRIGLPGRALGYATFYGAFLALLVTARQAFILLAKTDPPLISGVAWTSSAPQGRPWSIGCQDLFPETARQRGFNVATGLAGQILVRLRNASLKGAATSRLRKHGGSGAQAEGIPSERLMVIHNWVDGERIDRSPSTRSRCGGNGACPASLWSATPATLAGFTTSRPSSS